MLRFDGLLNQLSDVIMFSKIDLKVGIIKFALEKAMNGKKKLLKLERLIRIVSHAIQAD